MKTCKYRTYCYTANLIVLLLLAAVFYNSCSSIGTAGGASSSGLGGMDVFPQLGHTSQVNSVAFSPDGRQILSGARDGTLRIWDIITGMEIVQLIGYNDGEWLAITPDGFYNASPNGHRYINVRTESGVSGIEQYLEIYFRPDIVAARLRSGN